MSQVVLQPSGNKGSREHYRNTIDELVDLAAHRDLLGETLYQHLLSLFPSGQAPMWGVTPGQGDRNRASWQKIELGASALFAADKRIFSRGMIAAVFHNPPLARRLWGIDENGATWEYMYALDSVDEVNIPYAAFNAAVGYKSNNIIQGFTVLSEEKSDAFLQTFPASAGRVEWPATPAEVEEARRNLDGDLERRVEAWQRAEQSVLREALLHGLATGECALCGRAMDSRFLVAAHIKKRSCCTDSEKRDIANIGMLNCKFGCDELYERGFVSVDENWSVIVAPSLADETALAYIKERIQPAIAPRPWAAKYFDWHRQHHNL